MIGGMIAVAICVLLFEYQNQIWKYGSLIVLGLGIIGAFYFVIAILACCGYCCCSSDQSKKYILIRVE